MAVRCAQARAEASSWTQIACMPARSPYNPIATSRDDQLHPQGKPNPQQRQWPLAVM